MGDLNRISTNFGTATPGTYSFYGRDNEAGLELPSDGRSLLIGRSTAGNFKDLVSSVHISFESLDWI